MQWTPHRPVALILAALVAVTGVALATPIGAAAGPGASERSDVGQVQMQRFERWATITKIPDGYYYDAGQQNTHLVVTEVKGGLRYHDSRTDVLRGKPDACDRKRAKVGLVVVCRVPRDVSRRNTWQVKVFTRLGDDYVSTRALPAKFRLYGLADQGNDTFIGGKGNDFINGAPGRDHVSGGPGNDLVRGGENHDVVLGGPGNDKAIGLAGPDVVRGGNGNDRIGGHEGDDTMYAGPGTDFVLCMTGRDVVYAEKKDRILSDCERVRYI